MDEVWTREWPEEPGRYWFHGKRSRFADKPDLFIADVKGPTARGHMIYIIGGSVIFKEEGGTGWWRPVAIPPLPEEVQ